jgi:hypothetical protein
MWASTHILDIYIDDIDIQRLVQASKPMEMNWW